jgi:hypothetical protein
LVITAWGGERPFVQESQYAYLQRNPVQKTDYVMPSPRSEIETAVWLSSVFSLLLKQWAMHDERDEMEGSEHFHEDEWIHAYKGLAAQIEHLCSIG